jgi:hypothetical protein
MGGFVFSCRPGTTVLVPHQVQDQLIGQKGYVMLRGAVCPEASLSGLRMSFVVCFYYWLLKIVNVPGAAGNANEASGLEAVKVTWTVPSGFFWKTALKEIFIFGPLLTRVPVPATTTSSASGSKACRVLNLYS